MNQPTLDGVVERLEILEAANSRLRQECGRWRRGGLITMAGAVVLAIAGADVASRVAPKIEANEFVLRDQAGKTRGAFTIRPDGTPGFALFDANEKMRLSLDLGAKDKDRPGVNIYGEEGDLRAALTIRPDGTPGLGFFDKAHQPRLSLDMSEDDAAGLNLYGERGALRAALAIRPDGAPGLGFFNLQGQVVQSIDLGAEVEASRAQVR